MIRRLVLLGIALSASLLAGACGPLGNDHARRITDPVARAERTHEYPAAPPAAQRSSAPFAGAVPAVRAFAAAYINWTAATVTRRLRTLAALAVGQARAALVLAAAQTARDYELRRGGVANSGTVEAVAPIRGHGDEFAVVTRELTTATASNAYRGLKPAWHVAVATVARVPGGGWTLSGWQPEN